MTQPSPVWRYVIGMGGRRRVSRGRAVALLAIAGIVATATAEAASTAPFPVSHAGNAETSQARDPALATDPATGSTLVAYISGSSAVHARLIAPDGTVGPVAVVAESGATAVRGAAPFARRTVAVAHNTSTGEYLVAWQADLGGGEVEIRARRLGPGGQPVAGPVQVSQVGTPGNASYDAFQPAVAYDSRENQYLVAWHGNQLNPAPDDEFEIYAQRLAANGDELQDDFRVSEIGVEGSGSHHDDAWFPTVAYNSRSGEFLVAWWGDEVVDQFEIWAQRVRADGTQAGEDVRISTLCPCSEGNVNFGSSAPAAVYNGDADEYLVAWRGNRLPNATPPALENEIYVKRLSGSGLDAVSGDVRISSMGPDGPDGATSRAGDPAVAYDHRARQYVVAWDGVDDTTREIYLQRLSGAGAETGTDDAVISSTGRPATAEVPMRAAGAYAAAQHRLLVAWEGDDPGVVTVPNQRQIIGSWVDGGPIPAPVQTPPGTTVGSPAVTAPPAKALKAILAGDRTQRPLRHRHVALRVRCTVACTVRASGRVRVRGRSYPLRATRGKAAAGRSVRLRLRVPPRTLTVLRRTLSARQRATAVINVTVRDREGRIAKAFRRVALFH